MKLRLASRRSPDARCAFCHDALEGAIATCPRCLTPFHRDCRGHLSKCPTLGCETAFTTAPEVVLDHEVPASLASELIFERLPLLVLPAVVAVAWILWQEHQGAWPAWVFALLSTVWLAVVVVREIAFVAGLRSLLATEPTTMQLEIRVEPYHEGRIYCARLAGTDGRVLDLDLAPVLPAPPAC